MEKEINYVFKIIDEIKNGADAPIYYFEILEKDLHDAFNEDETIPPSIVLADYKYVIGNFCDEAKTEQSFEWFSTLYYIIDMVLQYYLTDLITVGA